MLNLSSLKHCIFHWSYYNITQCWNMEHHELESQPPKMYMYLKKYFLLLYPKFTPVDYW